MGIGCSDNITEDKIDIKIELQKHDKQVWYKSIRYIIANHQDFQIKKSLLKKLQCSDILFQYKQNKEKKILEMINDCYLNLEFSNTIQVNELNDVANMLNKNEEDLSEIKTVFSKGYEHFIKNQQNLEIQLICYHHFCKSVFENRIGEETALNQFIMKFKSVFITQFTSKLTKALKQNKFDMRKKVRRSIVGFATLTRECIKYLYDVKTHPFCATIFTSNNIDNFILSTLFTDIELYDFVFKIYQTQLKENVIKILNKRMTMSQSFNLNQNTINLFFKNKQGKPEQVKQQTQVSYQESIKILNSVVSEHIPIRKLQIIYNAIVQIEKDIRAFYVRYDIERTQKLSKSNLQKILFELIKCCNNQDLLISVSIIHDYTIKMNKLKKGSFIKLLLNILDQSYELYD